jgi:hypothetical protein
MVRHAEQPTAKAADSYRGDEHNTGESSPAHNVVNQLLQPLPFISFPLKLFRDPGDLSRKLLDLDVVPRKFNITIPGRHRKSRQ